VGVAGESAKLQCANLVIVDYNVKLMSIYGCLCGYIIWFWWGCICVQFDV